MLVVREGLGRGAGDLSGFQASRRGRGIPTVSTRGECQRRFEALGGVRSAE